MTTTCPWCSAPRDAGTTCRHCGAIYAKAEAIKAYGRADGTGSQVQISVDGSPSAELVFLEEPSNGWKDVDDPKLEWLLCIGAIPITLCIAVIFNAPQFGRTVQRIFFGMPIHEIGHAVTAWFCGIMAVPGLWKTLVSETRGFIAPLMLIGAIGYMIHRAYLTRRPALIYLGGALALLQIIATFGIDSDTAQMLITFGGDGAGMIIATLLMGSFFFGKDTKIYKDGLRWGFIVIGAAAFVDFYATWLRAHYDIAPVPYGTSGGIASDSMVLIDVYGWSMQTLIHRYVILGLCCLIVLTLVYAWGVWRAKAEIAKRQAAKQLV